MKKLIVIFIFLFALVSGILWYRPEYLWVLANGSIAEEFAVKQLASDHPLRSPDWAKEYYIQFSDSSLGAVKYAWFRKKGSNESYVYSPDMSPTDKRFPRVREYIFTHIWGDWYTQKPAPKVMIVETKEYKVKCIKAKLGDKDLVEGCNSELQRLVFDDDRVVFLSGLRGVGFLSFAGTEIETNKDDYEYKLSLDMAGGAFRSIGTVGDKTVGECIIWKPKDNFKKITCQAQSKDIFFDFEWQIINEWPIKK